MRRGNYFMLQQESSIFWDGTCPQWEKPRRARPGCPMDGIARQGRGTVQGCAQRRAAGLEVHLAHKAHSGGFTTASIWMPHGRSMGWVLMLISQIRNRAPRSSNPLKSQLGESTVDTKTPFPFIRGPVLAGKITGPGAIWPGSESSLKLYMPGWQVG